MPAHPGAAAVDTPELPPLVAALWGAREPGRRGPRPGLTVPGIVAAAIELADTEGLAAVSMARVAQTLGVTTMALYRYVANKDELLARMYDAGLADDPGDVRVLPPAPADAPAWRTGLHAWFEHQLALVARHPWLMQAVAANPPFGPHHIAVLETGLAALEDTPLSTSARTDVLGAASLLTLGEGMLLAASIAAARLAAAPPAEASAPPSDDAPRHPALIDYDTLLRQVTTPDSHPQIARALAAGAFRDDAGDTGAAFRVALFLDGVAALIDRAS